MLYTAVYGKATYAADFSFFFLCLRKIVDHVESMTSPDQVADYVKHFR